MGTAANPDHVPGDAVTFNRSGAPGAVTAKSIDLVVGGEASQRAAWSWTLGLQGLQIRKPALVRDEKDSTTALLSERIRGVGESFLRIVSCNLGSSCSSSWASLQQRQNRTLYITDGSTKHYQIWDM